MNWLCITVSCSIVLYDVIGDIDCFILCTITLGWQRTRLRDIFASGGGMKTVAAEFFQNIVTILIC